MYRIFQKILRRIFQKILYRILQKFGGRKFYSFHLKSLPINVKVKGVFQIYKKRTKKGCMLLGSVNNVGENCDGDTGNNAGSDTEDGCRDSKGSERLTYIYNI